MSCVGRCLTRASLSNLLVIYHLSVAKLEDRSPLDKGKAECTFRLGKFRCLVLFWEGEMRRLGGGGTSSAKKIKLGKHFWLFALDLEDTVTLQAETPGCEGVGAMRRKTRKFWYVLKYVEDHRRGGAGCTCTSLRHILPGLLWEDNVFFFTWWRNRLSYRDSTSVFGIWGCFHNLAICSRKCKCMNTDS